MIIDTDKLESIFKSETTNWGQVSELSGVSPQALYKYRSGQSELENMTISMAAKLMEANEMIKHQPADIKIKGTKQAVSEFNNWQGAAAVFFDKNKKEMWTNVYASGDDQTIYLDSNVVEIKSKSSLSENWNTTTMRELKTLAVGEL